MESSPKSSNLVSINERPEALDFSQHPERSEEEWKSLIQSGAYGTDFKPTEEFTNSELGKQAQADDEKLSRTNEIIQNRLSNINEQVASGHMTEEEATKIREQLIAKQEAMLNAAIEQREADYQVYADSIANEGQNMSEWVDSPEVQHLSREEIEKLGAAAMQAASVGPVTEPPIITNETQPDPAQSQPDQSSTPDQEPAQQPDPQLTPEEARLQRMQEKLNQQLAEGKAQGLTPELVENLRANMGDRLNNNLRMPKSNSDPASEPGTDSDPTANPDSGANPDSAPDPNAGPSQELIDATKEFDEWRAQGAISDEEYNQLIDNKKKELAARQKFAAMAAATSDSSPANSGNPAPADSDPTAPIHPGVYDPNKTDADAVAEADVAAIAAADIAAVAEADAAATAPLDRVDDTGNRDRASRVEHFKERFNNTSGAKKALYGVIGVALAAALAAGAFLGVSGAASAARPADTDDNTPAAAQSHNSDSTSFEDINDISANTAETAKTYDYSEWLDFEHKTGQYNYGYDYSGDHGNVEAMRTHLHDKADQSPQILSDYAFQLLSITELHDLGIVKMSSTSLSEYLSNPDNAGAAELKGKIATAVHNAINDSDLSFIEKTGPSFSTFMYGSDANGDGELTPNEMHLGYSQVNRVNAKQVVAHRNLDMEEVNATFNEDCGLQSDHETAPANMTHLSEDEVSKVIPDDAPVKSSPDKGGPDKDNGKPSDDKPSGDKEPSDDKPSGDKEPDDDKPKSDDSKDAKAIEDNMQTGDETSNTVEQRGADPLTKRPDTSQDSYQAEQDHQQQVVEDARGQQSESANGGTVGDIIDAADQTYASHENYTPEQTAAQQQQQQNQAAQAAANQAAAAQQRQAEQNANMTDAEAAQWLSGLQR